MQCTPAFRLLVGGVCFMSPWQAVSSAAHKHAGGPSLTNLQAMCSWETLEMPRCPSSWTPAVSPLQGRVSRPGDLQQHPASSWVPMVVARAGCCLERFDGAEQYSSPLGMDNYALSTATSGAVPPRPPALQSLFSLPTAASSRPGMPRALPFWTSRKSGPFLCWALTPAWWCSTYPSGACRR